MLCVWKQLDDHGGCWGNAAQVLAQWWHPVASSEAQDLLHWAMHLASYRQILKSTAIGVYFLHSICSLALFLDTNNVITNELKLS